MEAYKAFGNNLPVINDDPAWVLPMPARYVIGTGGVIAYSEVNPDYTQRPDPSELLPVWIACAPANGVIQGALAHQARCADMAAGGLFPYGNPRASIWPMSCRNRLCRLPLVPSRSNTEAGLPRLAITAVRGQCPALQSCSFSFSPCAMKAGASADDHASRIGSSIAVRPGIAERLS